MLESALPPTFTLSAIALSLAVLTTTLEFFSLRHEFETGIFSWRVLQTFSLREHAPLILRFREAVFGRRGMAAILAVRLVSAGALCAGALLSYRLTSICALAGVFVTSALLTYRCRIGLEGADVMAIIVATGLLVSLVRFSPGIWTTMGFGFIAAQTCLSYFTAGTAKLLSSQWRDGSAVYKIANTETYGFEAAALILRRRPVLSFAASWTIILFEMTFPLALVASSGVTLAIIVIGIMFHVVNARLMGLNGFLWAFVATYPAVWYCHLLLRASLGR
jgi:hypothetical protein